MTVSFKYIKGDGLQWTFGNKLFCQRLKLENGRFYCTSLLFKRTKREWIHPAVTSDEFLIQLRLSTLYWCSTWWE